MARIRSIFWTLAPLVAMRLLVGCSGGGVGGEQAGAQGEEGAGPGLRGKTRGDTNV